MADREKGVASEYRGSYGSGTCLAVSSPKVISTNRRSFFASGSGAVPWLRLLDPYENPRIRVAGYSSYKGKGSVAAKPILWLPDSKCER